MKAFLVGVVALAVSVPGCGGGADQGTPEPTPVGAEPTITEIFTGIVPRGGYQMHVFTLAVAPGMVHITLTRIGPPDDITEGLGVGTPAGDICDLNLGAGSYVNATASSSPQLKGTIQNPGDKCVVLFDIGQQTDAVTYSVTVSHS